jgi:ERCC4-type nuclease
LPVGEFLPTETRGLAFGDYSVTSDGPEGLGMTFDFAIELKRIPDLVKCCTSDRERFELQLARLRGVHFARLLILGHPVEIETGRYRSGVSPKAILGSISALEARHGVAVIWITEPRDAARWIARAAYFHWREAAKGWRKVMPCEIAYAAGEATLALPD